MMILNLDKNFKPLGQSDEILFEQFTFSGGEPHLKILSDIPKASNINITHRIKSFNDIGILLLAINVLRNMWVNDINLFLPYFPGARQDRIMVKGEAFTVKVYADLINQLELTSISIFDPHSDVTPALLNNVEVLYNYKFIKDVINNIDSEEILLVSPDAGALKKIHNLAFYLQQYDVIECSKTRNVNTRKLSEFKVYANDLEGKDCLIVDDICDGGRTFIGLAKELATKNAGKLYLAISHGIFSKGTEELSKYFDKIYCTDAFNNISDNNINQIKLETIIK